MVCCADYRSCHVDRNICWNHQVEDIKCAAAWFRKHHREYGAPDLPLCLGGISAGAHLVMLAHQEIGPAAMLLSSGVYHVSHSSFANRPTLHYILERHVIGSTDPDAWAKVSPLKLAERADSLPPMVVLHGVADSLSPVSDSQALCTAIKANAGEDRHLLYKEVPNGPHGWDYFDSGAVRKYAGLVDGFLSPFLNPGSPMPSG